MAYYIDVLNYKIKPFFMLIRILILVVVIYFIVKKGYFKSIFNSSTKNDKLLTIEDKYNSKKVEEQKELNKILEKINKRGYENLSAKEKIRLDKLSKK